MMIAAHDDMTIAGSRRACDALLDFPNKTFPVKNLGEHTHYMGCPFTRQK